MTKLDHNVYFRLLSTMAPHTYQYQISLLISYEKLGKLNKFIKVMLCVSLICLNIIHKEK